MPWHPPCALSNLIVTNLSSCQRIDFSIFDCFFLLRPTAKLFAFLRSCVISNTFATGFFTRCFSIWLCSFQSTNQFSRAFALRSLKTIQVQEEEQSTGHSALWLRGLFRLFGFLLFRAPHSFRCDRPGMNPPISLWILSLERR